MSKLFRRIFTDIKSFKKSNLQEQGIYCEFDDKNVYNVRAMIIGPKDTPYENGYYFFKLNFPSDYPLNPPKVVFYTQGYHIRLNPNLYTNGKVCLSILGTWPGPSWSSSCSLISVLLSLQTLLNEKPICNEPGWEDISKEDYRCINYNNILRYANLKIAVIKMIEETPSEFTMFKDIMLNKLHESKFIFENYLDCREKLNESAILKSDIYSLYIKTNYKECREKINSILKIPINKNNLFLQKDETIDNPEIDSNTEENNQLIKPKRQVPNGSANTFEVGFEKISENNGKKYVIYLTNKNKKRWKIKID
jgi:ubiquitin-conjugating enzyme E2 Z